MNIYLSIYFPDFDCNEDGSVYGKKYDPESGNCSCKAGWFGNKCQGKLHKTRMDKCYGKSHAELIIS